MSNTFVTLETRPDRVAIVRIDRPKMNALSVNVLRQLGATAKSLIADPPGAVVVWGGPHVFAAGAEISELGPEAAGEITSLFHSALDALAEIPRATVAAISGFALGGGCELALACDFRVASTRARLGQPEVHLGIIPGGGGTQRLARLIGLARAKDLIFTGRQVDAEEARSIGLVDRVVPSEEVLDVALEMAAQLARGAVVAQGLAKRAIDTGLSSTLEDGMALERRLFVEVFGTEDARIGVRSFLEKGPGQARFEGR